jgi:hypothetical protein
MDIQSIFASSLISDPKKLLYRVKKVYPSASMKDIREFLKNNAVVDIHAKKRKLQLGSVVLPLNSVQADLTFYKDYKSYNKGYWVILTVIDVNSRYAWAFPLKNKRDVVSSLEKIEFDKIMVDLGSEFISKKFKDFVGDRVIYANVGDKRAMSIVERFNLTLRNKIMKHMTLNNTVKWIDILDDIVDEYNNTIHSAINSEPRLISTKELEDNYNKKRADLLKIGSINSKKWFVGDMVRIPVKRGKFYKESRRYSARLYPIEKVYFTSVFVNGQKYNVNEIIKGEISLDISRVEKAEKRAKDKRKLRRENLT